jgi:tRNA(Ile)-lysidine synthase TilS/MesJ
VLETFFLSMFYERRLNTFGPVTYLGRKDVTLIRPFVFVPEKHIISVAKKLELPILPANCEVAGSTKREEMKDILRYFTTLLPDADERIMNAIADTEKYGMWDRLRLPPREPEGRGSGDGE